MPDYENLTGPQLLAMLVSSAICEERFGKPDEGPQVIDLRDSEDAVTSESR